MKRIYCDGTGDEITGKTYFSLGSISLVYPNGEYEQLNREGFQTFKDTQSLKQWVDDRVEELPSI